MNQHDSVGTRSSAVLCHVQQVAESFLDSLVGKHCRRKREKSVGCGLNPLQSLFGKLPIDKSLLIFLSVTLVLVFAAFHQHAVSSRALTAGSRAGKGLTALLPTAPTQERAVRPALPHPGHPTWRWEVDEGSSVLVLLSLWLQLPESAECWLEGQPGDRDISLLGSSGV